MIIGKPMAKAICGVRNRAGRSDADDIEAEFVSSFNESAFQLVTAQKSRFV